MDYIDLSTFINTDDKMNKMVQISCESHLEGMAKSKIYEISETCLRAIKNKYKNTAFVIDKKNIIIIGRKDIVIIKDDKSPDKIKTLFGENTGIKDVTSVGLSEKEDKIAVINENKSVLVFDKSKTGNVFPVRVFNIDTEIKADKIIFEKKRLTVLDSEGRTIAEFTVE